MVEEIRAAEYVHDPAEDDCTDCHDPHSGPYPKMLPGEKRALCAECHDDVVAIAEEAEVDHSTVLTGEECLRCHSPHAGNSEHNLREPEVALCLGCHDRGVESNGSKLRDIKGWLAKNKEWHEPIREQGCCACHEPHGSQNFRLLEKSFPSRFYAGFEVGTYNLCFSCHDDTAMTASLSRTVTSFRDGSRNLHFLHVNKATKGRSCRSCHEMHASSDSHFISERVPFGKWSMRLNYQQLETGGSCRPGCHRAETYDREQQ
jgi:predicted CXXCH cytochrome family protein